MKKRTGTRAGGNSRKVAERTGERFLRRTLIAVLLGSSAVAPLGVHLQAAPLSSASAAAGVATAPPNLAFFYAANPPVGELQAFDAVVVDPATGFEPLAHPLRHTTWIARTTAGEPGESSEAFIARQVEPLWRRGYRGFLLETPVAIAAAARIRETHPDARLVAGGADVTQAALPYAKSLYAVVGDSLVRGLDDSGRPLEVPEAQRADRLAKARAFTQQTGVPVVSVEYCARNDRQCARETAARVVAAGMVPYVTSRGRDVVGIGRIEVMPRKILVVQDRDTKEPLDLSAGVRDLATPLNYMGYDVEYADFSSRLPDTISPDRYAGVVAWIQRGAAPDPEAWQRWVAARMADHVPIAFLGQFGFDAAGSGGAALDLQDVSGTLTAPVSVVKSDPMVGFEINPKPEPRDLLGVRVGPRSQSLLRISANGVLVDQIALTPWGGYALSPYTVASLDSIEQERWAIQPMAFMKAALHLQDLPSPSVTTENGRRLFMSHVDGDGFASRAEFPGPDYSGEALYQQIFSRYKVPMTLSVIEGEVGAKGLHADISPRLEEIARKMFALPNVEIGTHTYSHPFQWEHVDNKTGAQVDVGGGDAAFSLNIPGYKFNIDREITGSIDYINSRLAPPGKKTVVLQWSGDCQPPAFVVRKVYEAGVYNFNGGDTVITKSANSWTNIAPIGVDKGPGAYQVYAPNQDENVYTNDWQGPFYGFTRVLETYAMTDRPLRFKPIDVYYHMYSGTKVASLRALDQIFSTVLKQPVLPVYVTEYIRKVLDWRTFAVAKEVGSQGGWVVRGDGSVRELHWPQTARPSLDAAQGVTGFSNGPDGTYIHIDDGSARFALGGAASVPYIAEANGFVRNFRRTPQGMHFEFAGHYLPFVKLANAQSCRISINNQPVAARRDGDFLRFDTPADIGPKLNYLSVEAACG
ncbi:polysaccharide deacetylase family protein [Paraburkholderia bryophila]|uniref:polysaccharide deacetylase family protein n=1 Tax=Paraburkholderia bryophila TaxID=420952 RepID=UPI0015CAC44E|nr:sugar ABC transporter [Paraburkholderia bryophila]